MLLPPFLEIRKEACDERGGSSRRSDAGELRTERSVAVRKPEGKASRPALHGVELGSASSAKQSG
jgi:hypothetical protein